MSAPIIEIEGTAIRVYRWADLNRSFLDRLRRKPARVRMLIGVFAMTNSPSVEMTRSLNAPSTITISPISARSPL